MFRSKALQSIIVTSDVAPVAGLPDGTYDCFGTTVMVEGNNVRDATGPNLAGSGALMFACIDFLCSEAGVANLLQFSPRGRALQQIQDDEDGGLFEPAANAWYGGKGHDGKVPYAIVDMEKRQILLHGNDGIALCGKNYDKYTKKFSLVLLYCIANEQDTLYVYNLPRSRIHLPVIEVHLRHRMRPLQEQMFNVPPCRW